MSASQVERDNIMERLTAYKSYNRDGPGSLINSIMPELRDTGFFFVKTGQPRLYYRVDTYLDYSSLFVKVNPRNRIYDELIPEHLHQKPRFDIDIELPRDPMLDYVSVDNPEPQKEEVIDTSLFQECLDALIDVLFVELPRLNLNKDIIVTTSHGPDGDKYKISGHVIVDNYCHLTSKEADFFGKKVVEQIPEKLRKCFDEGIWSPNHCLRMIRNTKVGKTRFKEFQETWKYRHQTVNYEYREAIRNENHKLNLQLEASLITVARKCKVIVVVLPEKATNYKSYGDLSESQYDLAVELFNTWWDELPGTRTRAYAPGKPENSFITLVRKKHSSCPICHVYPTNDKHTSNGAYILVQGNLQIDNKLNVRFGCYSRHSNGKTLLIGSINNTEIVEKVTFLKNDGTRTEEEYRPEPGFTINPKLFIANGVDPEKAVKLSQAYAEITEETPIPLGGFIDDREIKPSKSEIKKEIKYQEILHTPGPALEQVHTKADKSIPPKNPVIVTSDGLTEAPKQCENNIRTSFRSKEPKDVPDGDSMAPPPPPSNGFHIHRK